MIEIRIPKLGLTMQNATVVEWKFGSGDRVKKGDVILIIETDKVTYEVEAPADGIFHPIVEEGKRCKVQEVVAYLAEDQAEYQEIIKRYPILEKKEEEEVPKDMVQTTLPSPLPQKRIKASPLARAIAKEHNLDLSVIEGSGPGGRIIRRDVLKALEIKREVKEEKALIEIIPIKGIRRTIFDNMFLSLSQSAQLTLHTDAGAESIVRLQDQINAVTGKKVSYNAFFIKIVATVLRRHPRINASVDGDNIKVWKDINIGFAMEKDEYLIVPVVRAPDKKGLLEIEDEIANLIDRARKGQLSPDELSGGTFTITNLGFAGIDHFTPIIRPPESAILGIGRIIDRAVVRDGKIVAEKRIGLSLTFDHRIIDGAPASRFLKDISSLIENPSLILAY
ncbi:MAG TPA: 2-oxo acid dehydrogenase subunit E2 [Desulfobacteraceae bacterium]|nr:2-oxo acid dehydrogenase subunit E2 [Desulfobacteraceae bacterium]